MAIYDVDYREKGNSNAEVKTLWVSAHTGASAKLIAKGTIPKDCTIIKIKKTG